MDESIKNIGLIVDEGCAAPHVAELVSWIGTQPSLRLSSVIVQKGMEATRTHPDPARLHSVCRRIAFHLFSGLGWRLITWVEERRLHKRKPGPVAPDFASPGRTQLVVRPTGSGMPGTYVLSDADIARLKAERLELLIQCGTGTWSGGALGGAKLGMILFKDIANESSRGGPPGFWEVYHRTAKTEFIIKHVSPEATAPAVLRRGYSPTQTYALLNVDLLLKLASSHLRQVLVVAAKTGALPLPGKAIEYTGSRHRTPSLVESVVYFWKLSARAAAFRFREAVGLRERWGVSYAVSNWRDVKLSEGLKISNPEGRYFADPFLLTVGDETFCFVEDFVEANGRAVISVLQLGPNGYSFLGKAIEEDFHLSFPYLFEYDGDLYMCPESHQAREIRVYKCTRFPLEWKLHSVCMTDLSAVDTMIFASGDRWWMLTNIDNTSVGHGFSELHLFSATDPLSAQWKSHPLNPIIVDPEFARNAGLLHENGVIYRVSQARGFGVYGSSASFFEITVIDAMNYEEKLIKTIHPTHERGLTGVHHFNSTDGYTVWDQKRWAWGQ